MQAILSRTLPGGLWDATQLDHHLHHFPLFTQLDVLCHFKDGSVAWKETARWLKYEEKVELSGRWSKPYVSTSSLHAILKLRQAFQMEELCVADFNLPVQIPTLAGLADSICKSVLSNKPDLSEFTIRKLNDILRQPHKHKDRIGQKKRNFKDRKYRQDNNNKIIKPANLIDVKDSNCINNSNDHTTGIYSTDDTSILDNVTTTGNPAVTIVNVTADDTATTAATATATAATTTTTLNKTAAVTTIVVSTADGDEILLAQTDEKGVRSNSLKLPLPASLNNRRKSLVKRDGKDYWSAYTTFQGGVKPCDLQVYKPNKHLMGKMPNNTETASLLIGQVDFLNEPITAFFRLKATNVIEGLSEVALPTRFIFLAIGPFKQMSIIEYSEIGRAMASLLNDKVFSEVAYNAYTLEDLLIGIDEYIDDLTVLPPSIWDPTTRLEPPVRLRTKHKIWRRLSMGSRNISSHQQEEVLAGNDDVTDPTLMRTGKLFGGLVEDVKRRYKYFWSDLKDGFHVQCVASIIFLYFACITPIVTFGGLMGRKTDNQLGTMETLMSAAVCGCLYALFSGQPLTIIGATGPLLVFESILYHLCKENSIDFLSFRCWIGFWSFFYLMVIVAFDLSSYVRYITRFTEESFAVLISLIFIVEAFSKIIEIWYSHPVLLHPRNLRDSHLPNLSDIHKNMDDVFALSLHAFDGAESISGLSNGRISIKDSVYGGCFCLPPEEIFLNDDYYPNEVDGQQGWNGMNKLFDFDVVKDVIRGNFTIIATKLSLLSEDCITLKKRILINSRCMSISDCQSANWITTGSECKNENYLNSVPDVFLLSFLLFFATFIIAFTLRTFRNSPFFPSLIRNLLGDFSVFLSIVVMTSVDYLFGLETPKLEVPTDFKPTSPNRGWIVNPLNIDQWWLIIVATFPGLLATILISLDQQITAVIINRKENKLKKGHGYHLDLFVLAILIAICSFMGLPWFVAATVRAITHVKSLIRESEVKVPGEKPQMLGVREQRVTGFLIHLFIGLSTQLTPVLKLIPMPVLYGVFLYMGITSLGDVQFVQRVLLLFMPIKHQPDYVYLRHVKTKNVHFFTIIQVACSALMWTVKSIKATSIAFPLVLIALIGTRKIMDVLFSQRDLYWLDNLLPESKRRKEEDIQKIINMKDTNNLQLTTLKKRNLEKFEDYSEIPTNNDFRSNEFSM